MPSNKRFLIAITDLDSGEQKSGHYENFLIVGDAIEQSGKKLEKVSHLISLDDDETLERLRNHANYIVDEGHRRNLIGNIENAGTTIFDVEGMTNYLKSLVSIGMIDLDLLDVTPDCDCVRCQALIKLKGAN